MHEMLDILVTPGTPFLLASLAGVCIAILGMQRLTAVQSLALQVRTVSAGEYGSRLLFGQIVGGMLALIVVLTVLTTGLAGNYLTLALISAGAIYLYIGLIIPRRPIVRAQKERRRLRMLTPGFVSYVRVALAGNDAPGELLSRYIRRPRPRIAAMQLAVADALQVMEAQRSRPFASLAHVARERGCRELIDVTESLAQAEAEGADVQAVLEAQEITLQQILRDEFTQMLKRRTLYLIAMVAVSLVIGIVGNLLFVITGGGAVLVGV